MSLESLLPSIISAAGTIGGGIIASNANDSAAQAGTAGLNNAAGILTDAYGRQLGSDQATLQALARLADYQYADTATAWASLPPEMQRQLAANAAQYGTTVDSYFNQLRNIVQPATDQFGQSVQGAAGTYAGALGKAAGNFSTTGVNNAAQYGLTTTGMAGDYAGGLGGVGGDYAGGLNDIYAKGYGDYAAGGPEAIGEIRGTAALDPSVLTAAQQATLDQNQRDARAQLGASGLAGAGAAEYSILKKLRDTGAAGFEQQNQARVDNARNQLLSAGLTGASAIAGAGAQGLGVQLGQANTGLGAIYNTGLTGASTLLGAQQAGNQAGLNAANTGAGAIQTATNTAANQQLQTANNLGQIRYTGGLNAGQVGLNNANAGTNYYGQIGQIGVQNLGNYYQNLGNITAAAGQANNTAIMGPAQALAGAQTGSAGLNANAGTADANMWGQTLGRLSAITANSLKPPVQPVAAPTTAKS